MRVYLPCTLPALARLLASADIGPAPLRGFAVTPALREWYVSGDLEELEYVAMTAAARASLRLLLDDPDSPPRRVVLAVEIPDERVVTTTGPGDPALVEIDQEIPVRLVVSGHIDDPGAADDIRAAVAALPKADDGDDDARFAVDGAEGHELLWYASQELAYMAG
ncbi:MAG: hypothetical protein ABSA03_13350 [Streptosporangiaceae bacterium]|jgi:hypothetical protein